MQQLQLLKHGHKFTPTTAYSYYDFKHDVERFANKLKIREVFFDSPNDDESIVRKSSQKEIASEDKELSDIIRLMDRIEPVSRNTALNLSRAEQTALTELMNNDEIIIKPADKGGCLVIMDKDFYRDKLVIQDHLSTDTYQQSDSNSDAKTMDSLRELANSHNHCLTNKERDYICNFQWKTSEFYVLPKIHKSESIIAAINVSDSDVINVHNPIDLKGRPIVACCSSPIKNLSKLIELILKPLVKTQKTFVLDDWDFLRKLPRHLDFDCDLYAWDIVSLYTSIPHELGLLAIRYWYNRCRDMIDERFTQDFIVDSVQFILEHNYFLFDNIMYRQVKGTAMGPDFAPPYACLSVGFLEETKLFDSLQQVLNNDDYVRLITNLKRYMDDGFVPLPKSIPADTFLQILNDLHPSIKFTLEKAVTTNEPSNQAVQSVNFLDVTVILNQSNQISTDIYYKNTNAHDYLHFDSFHPQHTLRNIPFNLAKRIIVFVSDETLVEKRLHELRLWLKRCKYPKEVIDKAFHNAKLQGPAPQKPKSDNIIPFVSTHASNLDIQSTLNAFKLLLSTVKSDHLKNVFDNTRVVLGLRQPKSILRLISNAKFSSTTATLANSTQPTPGIHTGSCRTDCNLCRLGYMQPCTSFKVSNGTIWEVKSRIHCNSKNVIYYLTCNMCNGETTYVGKTCTTLRARMNNHISGCRNSRTSDVFDLHVHHCGLKNKNLSPPYFKVYAFMSLTKPDKLIVYEKSLQRRGFDTLNG